MVYKLITVHRASDNEILGFECFDTEAGFQQFCEWLAMDRRDCGPFYYREWPFTKFQELYQELMDEPVEICLNHPHEYFVENSHPDQPPQEAVVEYYSHLLEHGRVEGLRQIKLKVVDGTIDQLGTDGNVEPGA